MNLPPRIKSRYVARLYKDAVQVGEYDVRLSRRPPLTISATAEKSWNCGGEMTFCFPINGVPVFDEIWLGNLNGDTILEEWELLEVKRLPPEHMSSENEEYITVRYGHMRYKSPEGRWTNWSVLQPPNP